MKRFFLVFVLVLLAILPAVAQSAQVQLQWTPNAAADQVTKYIVYEKIGGQYVKLLEVTPSACTPTDCNATLPGVTAGVHTYAVTAANLWGESGRSNEVASPPPAGSPMNLKIIITVIIGGQEKPESR